MIEAGDVVIAADLPQWVASQAIFSPDMLFRYLLVREWEEGVGICTFIMLNPSTADALVLDPTVTRCVNFARRWGYKKLYVLNLFAWRSTDPKALYAVRDPVGHRNMAIIKAIAAISEMVVCAWGVHGAHKRQGDEVVEILRTLPETPVYHLGLTKDGHPKHPLYLRNDVTPVRWWT